MAYELFDGETSVCEHPRHIGAEKGIREEEEDDRHHRYTDDTPRRLDNEQDSKPACDNIGGCDGPCARYELTVLDDDVGWRCRPKNGKDHIDGMKEVIPRPCTPKGIEEIGKRKTKSEMNGTLQLRIENTEGRCIELKDRKANRNRGNHLLRPTCIVDGVRFAVILLKHGFRSLLIGHREVHILWKISVPPSPQAGQS